MRNEVMTAYLSGCKVPDKILQRSGWTLGGTTNSKKGIMKSDVKRKLRKRNKAKRKQR